MASNIDSSTGFPILEDADFKVLSKLIYEETRIVMGEHKKALVTSRLGKRLRILSIDSFSEYINFVQSKNGKEEFENFVNSVTTNKTDFFRENKHFEFMKSTFLPAWEEAYKRGEVQNLRVWSSACSSGEEPYSILITLYEYFGNNMDKYDIKVLATDIDTSVLEHAQNGVYRDDVVAPVPINLLKKYFLRGKGDNDSKYKVKDLLKKYVIFRQLNFKEDNYDIHTTFDLIFCRNVIIYFDKDFQKYLFTKLHSYMKDSAYIFIGHSETLFGVSDKFKYVTSNVYERL